MKLLVESHNLQTVVRERRFCFDAGQLFCSGSLIRFLLFSPASKIEPDIDYSDSRIRIGMLQIDLF